MSDYKVISWTPRTTMPFSGKSPAGPRECTWLDELIDGRDVKVVQVTEHLFEIVPLHPTPRDNEWDEV